MGFLIDADRHIDVTIQELLPYIDQPWRFQAEAKPGGVLPRDIGDLSVGGRLKRPAPQLATLPADISIVFPDRLLGLGMHPNPRMDAAVAVAYARWLTGYYLPQHPNERGMLYLPLRDPQSCLNLIEQFGEQPGIVGAFMTNAGFPRIHDNIYAYVYQTLQERNLILGFHPTSVWLEKPMEVFDRYLAVYALGHPFHQLVHLINWILHGMPELFPDLKCLFFESGLAWIHFIAHRLDQEYMKRPSEAPLLRDRPSHYISRCYFTTQPLEQTDASYMRAVMDQVNISQLLYASNFPQWDFDVPSVIQGLTLLDDHEKQAILWQNADQLFGLQLDRGSVS